MFFPNTASFDDTSKTVNFTPLEEFYHGDNTIGTVNYSYGGVFVGSADVVYYNSGYPINSTVFLELWPKFLVTPSDADTEEYAEILSLHLPDEPSPTPAVISEELPDKSGETVLGRREMIIGGAAALILLFIAVYLICFELPYRRKHRK